MQNLQNIGQQERSLIGKIVGGSPEIWTISEIVDGNVNLIFRVDGPKGTALVKQAVPYLRCVGESWPLSMKRTFFEYQALTEHSKVVPQLMPKVFGYDSNSASLVMEFLNSHIILRKEMMTAKRYPHFAEHISDYMAKTLFFTSDLALSAAQKKTNMEMFCGNTDLCKITEDLIFTDPYRQAEQNKWTSPQLDQKVNALQNDVALKVAVTQLKEKFLTRAEALIHGDLHSGSIMVNEHETKVIDPEFAFYGPMGFDVGLLIANFFLSFFSQSGWEKTKNERAGYEEWILEETGLIWTLFARKFSQLWDESLTGDLVSPNYTQNEQRIDIISRVREQYMARLLNDTLGFTGAEMIRRIVGLAHVADLDLIENPERRAQCESRALIMARELMVNCENYKTIESVIKLAREMRCKT